MRGAPLAPLVLALAWGAGACRTADAPGVFVDASTSIFDPEFVFACSSLPEVGCDGVFAPRVAETGTSPARVGPVSGEDALAMRIDSLHAAKRSIRIQALIFRADEAGLYVAEILKAKKREGVDVRVIVDAASNLDWQTQWMYFDLKRHGIEVQGYEAMYLEWITAEKLLEPLHANKRFHDKLWVVDGEDPERGVAIVGGLNVANEYFRIPDEPLQRWHDQDVVLRGPIVADVSAAFDRNDAFFAAIKAERPAAFNPDNAWKLSASTLDRVAAVDVPYWRREDLAARVQACTGRDVEMGFSPRAARFLQSRPRLEESYILQAYLNLVERARTSILVANAYFVPSKAIAEALRRAAARGVEVVVVTNSPETNDIAQVAVVSRYLYKEVMAPGGGGARVFEWIGPAVGEGTLHAKYAIFDAEAVLVGSYNLDPRSERLNSETAVALADPELAGRMEASFRSDVLSKSREIGWDEAAAFRKPEGVHARFELLFSLPMKEWL
jgi:putative cardiolipin synthase